MSGVVACTTQHTEKTDLTAIAIDLKDGDGEERVVPEKPADAVTMSGAAIRSDNCGTCRVPPPAGSGKAGNPAAIIRVLLEGARRAGEDASPAVHHARVRPDARRRWNRGGRDLCQIEPGRFRRRGGGGRGPCPRAEGPP
ncbi:hypothetical protein [Shinella pollutisoli]|uniref:Uncharacterized protein n=1 Tax=Shinella pollutisoli TaxID=2250594 RepID=A0ABV7DFC4_9HYPH|nr:hypothetical protein [Shinella pollutisoli]